MAVTSEFKRNSIRLLNADKKGLATFTGIDPALSANSAALFANSVNALRTEPGSYTYLITESLLTETP